MNRKYATVDELIIILQRVSSEGWGDAEVGCNGEYALSLPTYEEEKPECVHLSCGRFVNFGVTVNEPRYY